MLDILILLKLFGKKPKFKVGKLMEKNIEGKVVESAGKIEAKTRKVVQIKGSFYLNIPKSFANKHGIASGDIMAVILGTDKFTAYPTEK